MSVTPAYLDSLTGISGVTADFINRIPGVPVDTDKWATLSRLQPWHDQRIKDLGFSPEQLWLAEQVHGADIALIPDDVNAESKMIPGVDGLIASGKFPCLLGIYVADCAAIWLYDTRTRAIGLLHSGKKGTEGNISQAALDKMSAHFGTRPGDVIAVISPCVRPPHYETDIAATIREQLLAAGLSAGNITDSCLNTGADLDTFYSYRMEKGATGRMLALLGRHA